MANETQHTPEPWRVGIPGTVVADSSEGITIRGGTGDEVVEFYGGNLICESVSVMNAGRIVECVNACKGIKHPSEWITRARDLVRSEEELKFKVSELTDQLNEATNAAVQWKNDCYALEQAIGFHPLEGEHVTAVELAKATIAQRDDLKRTVDTMSSEIFEMLEALEAISDGTAFDKETGLIWSHWLDKIKHITDRVNNGKVEGGKQC